MHPETLGRGGPSARIVVVNPRVSLPNVNFEALVGHLREGLQVIDPSMRYVYLNPAAAAHGQTTPEALIGKKMSEAYPGIEHTEMYSHIERLMAEGGAHQMENEFTLPSGETGWFELRMERIAQGVVVLSLDVTERKVAERNLLTVQRLEAIGELAGGVAHDFNNLLTVIRGSAEFVRGEIPDGAAMGEDVDALIEATKQATELTSKLLAISRGHPVKPAPVGVRAGVQAIARLLSRSLGPRVVLDVTLPDDAGTVVIDPSALEQILLNLAINGRDAMPGGGRLAIGADTEVLDEPRVIRGQTLAPGGYAVVTVTDEGEGMAKDVLDHIFEPFFTTKGGGRGTGLGLASVWGLVAQARGAVEVESVVGAGTTFRVYLPQQVPGAATGAPASVTSSPGRGETVLVVDDQAPVRAVMVRVLRGAGYRVLEADSGAAALLRLEEATGPGGPGLDLVVSDVVMPGMDGIELMHRVHAAHPQVPALMVSGFSPAAIEPSADPDVVVATLLKPFSAEDLRRAVRGALDGVPVVRADEP